MSIIHTHNLTKIYKTNFPKREVNALQDLNLEIPKGSIFGLLGPNGAGKTTLVKILLNITHPTKGSAEILGEDIYNYKIHKKIGYLPENHKYPNYLTAEQVLSFFGKLSGCDERELPKKIDHLLELVNLEKWKKVKVKNYSKGMMQRLGLAQAIINDPELIFLDEPTDGVDPIGRKEIRELLLRLKEQGKTIFLNSHLLSEVEMITDRVAILHKGILLKEGTVSELSENKMEYKISVESFDHNFNFERFNISKINGLSFEVKTETVRELNEIIDALRSSGLQITAVEPIKNSLEDIFVSLIQKTEGAKN